MKLFLISITRLAFLLLILFSCNEAEKTGSNLNKAQAYLIQNNLDSAEYFFNQVLAKDSNHIESINKLAEIHFRKVEIGKALKRFEQSVSIDSTDAEIHLKIAEIKLFLGDYKEVFNSINKGLRINNKLPEGYFMKGVAYKHLGDTTKAISSYKTAIELNHDYAEVYYELGLLLTLQKDPLAIDYYKNGIEVSKEDNGLKLSLAWSYDVFGKFKEADEIYKSVLTEEPDFPEGKYNYAIFKKKLNQLDTSLILCNEALEIGMSTELLNLKGLLLTELGREEEAAAVMKELKFFDNDIGF